MDHTESALMKLNKEDFAHLLLDYQGKFTCILDNLKNYFDEFKAKFTKIEADRLIINIERKSFANEQYSRKLQKGDSETEPSQKREDVLSNFEPETVNLSWSKRKSLWDAKHMSSPKYQPRKLGLDFHHKCCLIFI